MSDGARDHELLPLCVAAAIAWGSVGSLWPVKLQSAEFDVQLDRVALELSSLITVYARTDVDDRLLPLSGDDLRQGVFRDGAQLFVHQRGTICHALKVRKTDLFKAIEGLASYVPAR